MAIDAKTLISASPNWHSACGTLIDALVSDNACFSSGELTAMIRLARPDLAFSATKLGEHTRDLFYGGGMPSYTDPNGNTVPVTQVPRVTQGLGRTPAGIQVFVYCPDPALGDAHDFEIDIPLPPGMSAAPVPPPMLPPSTMLRPPTRTAPTTPAPKSPVNITGAVVPSNALRATVHVDRRCCVPRGAFETFVHLTGQPLQGGQPVHITFEGSTAVITLNPRTDPSGTTVSTPYDIAVTRGRVLFPAPVGTAPYTPNTAFAITATKDHLMVDLSATV